MACFNDANINMSSKSITLLYGFLAICVFTTSVWTYYSGALNRTVLEKLLSLQGTESYEEKFEAHQHGPSAPQGQNAYISMNCVEKTIKAELVSKITPETNAEFLLSPIKDAPGHSHFLSGLFPNLFVSAHEFSHTQVHSETFEYAQIFYFIFCSIELFLFFSHLLVHLGVKNSRYRFLTKQSIYFATDGSLSLTNLIVFWDSYFFMKAVLIYAVAMHLYYVIDLCFTSGKSNIFKWSSVDLAKNRFSLENFRENFETFCDDCCHFNGFLSAFLVLSDWLKVFALGTGLGVLWILVLKAKFFFTKKHMMPSWLKDFIPEDSR